MKKLENDKVIFERLEMKNYKKDPYEKKKSFRRNSVLVRREVEIKETEQPYSDQDTYERKKSIRIR